MCNLKGKHGKCPPKPAESKTVACWEIGDVHYHTFDGKNYDFKGTCTYVMAKNCAKGNDLPYFEVLAKNEKRGSLRMSYVALVTVKVYDTTISVARSEMGGVRVRLWNYAFFSHN